MAIPWQDAARNETGAIVVAQFHNLLRMTRGAYEISTGDR